MIKIIAYNLCLFTYNLKYINFLTLLNNGLVNCILTDISIDNII